MLDVDAFALLNQDYGPDAADDVLCELATRLVNACGVAALGRWQADEFVVVMEGHDAPETLSSLLVSALAAAREPFELSDGPVRLSVSAGYAASSRLAAGDLFGAASAAMADAKTRGRDRVVRFEGEVPPAGSGSGLRMAHDLDHALKVGEMRLHYQPIIELATNDVVGVEALVRWQRSGVGLLLPGAFIELAERTGQIIPLGHWIIRQACRAAVELAGTRLAPIQVSINISARQLADPGLVETFERALHDTGCEPATIIVEVTETGLLHDLGAATAVLESIQALGVDLDLDDFGTGYSSLLYLRHFPVSRIKIDSSFVAGLGTDIADTAIVASTIALAHSVGLTAIAEGVESARQLTMLRQMGCDFAQGYLFSPPLPELDLVAWFGEQSPARLLDRLDALSVGAAAAVTSVDEALREHAADRRDHAGDRRDVAGEERDEAGDIRDLASDERDHAGDLRDQAGDLRDDAADLRDQQADQRDRAADRRDDQAPPTATGSQDGALSPHTHPPDPAEAMSKIAR